MLVFVTGATGFIGSKVVKSVQAAGHEVLALARNDAAVDKAKTLGATPHSGSLTDIDSLKAGATQADAVLHLGFIHDFSDFAGSCAKDYAAVSAMLEALEGSGKPFVNTSGTLYGAGTTPFTERDGASSPNARSETEKLVVAAAARGVRSISIRLSPSVHGPHEHGFVPALIGFASKVGHASFVDDGSNIWPAVHVDDAAALYVLALDEKVPAGTVLHGVAETVVFKDIAGAIAKGLGLEAKSVDRAQAADALGFLAHFASLDNPTTSDITRELTGWTPKGKTLLDDMATGTYFA